MLTQLQNTAQRYWQNLHRSSALQQGLLNIGIFLFSLFLLSVVTYFFVQNALSTRLDNNLQQRINLLVERLQDEDWDEDELDEMPCRPINRIISDKTFCQVFPQRELKLESNKLFRKKGFSTIPPKSRVFNHAESRYRILVRHRSGMVFVAGEDNDNDQEILEIVMSAFLLNGLVALILTALLVMYLGHRSHRQIRRIEHVLQHAAQGNLKERVGASGKNNDLAHVSVQIDSMMERLETSLAAMTDISANIAHELKTPIARLRNDLTQALDQHEQGRDITAALQSAYEESGQITETFDALLRIAQIEGGARKENFTQTNLWEILHTVLEIYQEVAEDAGMSLTVKDNVANNPTFLVPGDKELLVQMFANLVENSLRYCPDGTEVIMGMQSVAGAGKQQIIECTIADNGPGIPDNERERVFQRLYRLDKSRTDQKGTGLGLSLVKAIVELHEAEIELQDNGPGLRTIVRFYHDKT